MKWIQIGMAGVVLTGFLATAAATEPNVAVVDCHNADVKTIIASKKAIRVEIHSRTGIGRATLRRSGCQWPESLTLRLHLRGLESLQLTSDEHQIRVEAISDRAGEVQLLVEDKTGNALPATSPLRPNVTRHDSAEKANPIGYFDVLVPAPLLASNQGRLEIRWIDFFR